MKVQLNPKLERSILAAIAQGLAPLNTVERGELSKEGQGIWDGLEHLLKKAKPPFALRNVLHAAVEVRGAESGPLAKYFAKLPTVEIGPEIQDIVESVKMRQRYVRVITEAGQQIQSGDFQPSALTLILTKESGPVGGIGAEELFKDGLPEKPTGIGMEALPKITKASGGFFGVWAMAGEPGSGKTCLAFQIALIYGEKRPVLYYDLDDTGADTFAYRAGMIARGDLKKARKSMENIRIYDSISTLDQDLLKTPGPALVVVDMVQSLPTMAKHRRTSLDQWIVKLKQLSHQNYDVLLVSEKPRAQYGSASMAAYKETGEIEYAASFGVQLIAPEPDDDGNVDMEEPIKFIVVKNRHYKVYGVVANLVRCKKREWWFVEENFKPREVD